jgi:UDP-N-acetylmuramate dehydrogenase
MAKLTLRQMPPVKGRLQANVSLGPLVWMQAGGPANILFKPQDAEDLSSFLAALPPHIPCTVLGMGSNVLIRDGGIPGVVIKLGKGFNNIEVSKGKLHVGAGALDRTVALFAADNGLAGFEYLVGIPGTIGGAIKMNAGAYGQEVKDNFISCDVIDRHGQRHTLTSDDIQFTHRTSTLPPDMIVVSAVFKTAPADPHTLHAQLKDNMEKREQSQPIQKGTGGSTFKNPLPQKAWALIDQAGCRGLRVGQAHMSQKHCNFMINDGGATADDLEALGHTVQDRVKEKTNITLAWEIQRLGIPQEGSHD